MGGAETGVGAACRHWGQGTGLGDGDHTHALFTGGERLAPWSQDSAHPKKSFPEAKTTVGRRPWFSFPNIQGYLRRGYPCYVRFIHHE